MELKCTYSNRGFAFYEEQIDRDGNKFRVSESSLATEPAIRLTITHMAYDMDGSPGLHLTEQQARLLARSIYYALKNHYQISDKRGSQ